MKKIVEAFLKNKDRTMPILSFPSASLLGITIRELISDSTLQAKGMQAISRRAPIAASLNMMDLSVEAEAFGASIRFSDNEIPTVEKGIIDDISFAPCVRVPKVGDGRTSVYIDGIKKAKALITDIPVFCGIIGPYSLAGRLYDMTNLMLDCFDNPEEVHILLKKTAAFLTEYLSALKNAGADGVILAEPAAGLLSPALTEEFSSPYVKEIIAAVSDENFVVCYHNCGNAVVNMAESIASLGADIYHFGNAISLRDIIPLMPESSVVMGNINPLLFVNSTPEGIAEEVKKLYNECAQYDNFIISSGCDIPFNAKWENLDAYFGTVKALYSGAKAY